MAGTADRRIREALEALASAADPPAAGVASALTGALAASLVELSAGLAATRLGDGGSDSGLASRMQELSARAAELREGVLRAADEDVVAYSKVAAAADDTQRAAALAAAADPPLAIAEASAEIAEAASETASAASEWAFGADAAAAAELAAAAARAAARLVDADLGDADDPRRGRARDASERATTAAAACGSAG